MNILESIFEGLVSLRLLEWKIAAVVILMAAVVYILEWMYKTIFKKKYNQGS